MAELSAAETDQISEVFRLTKVFVVSVTETVGDSVPLEYMKLLAVSDTDSVIESVLTYVTRPEIAMAEVSTTLRLIKSFATNESVSAEPSTILKVITSAVEGAASVELFSARDNDHVSAVVFPKAAAVSIADKVNVSEAEALAWVISESTIDKLVKSEATVEATVMSVSEIDRFQASLLLTGTNVVLMSAIDRVIESTVLA